MNPERIRLSRMVIHVAMASAPQDQSTRAGKAAWRSCVIEAAYLEEIDRAKAQGLRMIEAGAAQADDPMRRLRQHRNGTWQMRITITTDPRKVGEQKTFNLETSDFEEAPR